MCCAGSCPVSVIDTVSVVLDHILFQLLVLGCIALDRILFQLLVLECVVLDLVLFSYWYWMCVVSGFKYFVLFQLVVLECVVLDLVLFQLLVLECVVLDRILFQSLDTGVCVVLAGAKELTFCLKKRVTLNICACFELSCSNKRFFLPFACLYVLLK